MTLEEYVLASVYVQETYMRRDIAYIMSKIYEGKKGNDDPKKMNLYFEQEGIKKWVESQYEKADKGTVIGGRLE